MWTESIWWTDVGNFGKGDDDTVWMEASGVVDVQFRRDSAKVSRLRMRKTLFLEHTTSSTGDAASEGWRMTTWPVFLQFQPAGRETADVYDDSIEITIFNLQRTAQAFRDVEIVGDQ